MSPSQCAVCGPDADSEELYAEALDATAFSARVFSARRPPDRLHYRIVRCQGCGLVRSDPVADPGRLADLYRESGFDYGPEVPVLTRTYGHYLDRLKRVAPSAEVLLEIGCGNGFMLERALASGWHRVIGVEPSEDAAAHAASAIRPAIIVDVMRPGLVQPDSVDACCMYQVFDHIADPAVCLDQVRAALRPGGALLLLNHDITAMPARLLGERSPIIDVEHTYLYSLRTIRRLLEQHGYEWVEGGRVMDRLRFRHLLHLLPLPRALKARLMALLGDSRIGGMTLRLPLGNLYAIARRAPTGPG